MAYPLSILNCCRKVCWYLPTWNELILNCYMFSIFHQVPQSWQKQTFQTNMSVIVWCESLSTKWDLLNMYLEQSGGSRSSSAGSSMKSPLPVTSTPSGVMPGQEKTLAYNLATFSRPDRFVQSLIVDHCRRQFRDLLSCALDIQVICYTIIKGFQ